jgi:hypothetical protein
MSEVAPRQIIGDARIAAFLAEAKQLPEDWMTSLRLPDPQRGHRCSELEVPGETGTIFEIRLRQASLDPLAFSAVLSVLDLDGIRRFRLRRYNGRSHGHRNRLEGTRLGIGFHIHSATERYQRAGFDEDAFAEVTDRYGGLWEAVGCLIEDCGFRDDASQGRLVY